jgi:hypothetical protein
MCGIVSIVRVGRERDMKLYLVTVLVLVLGSAMAAYSASADCSMPDGFNDPHPVMHDGSKSLFWVRPLQVDADGAPNAYHRDDPHGNKGLAIEYAGNGMTISRNGKPMEFKLREEDNAEWLGIYQKIAKNDWKAPPGHSVEIYGFARSEKNRVCTMKDGRLVSPTSLVRNPNARLCDPKRYVNALEFSGIVVPNRTKGEKPVRGADPEVAPPFARLGVSRGDLAIVYNPETRVWKGAFIYDTGPRRLLGEGSINLVMKLRNQEKSPTSALETNAIGIVETHTLVFPGTLKALGPRSTWTQQKIDTLAAWQFEKWGGGSIDGALGKLSACADAYKTRYPNQTN